MVSVYEGTNGASEALLAGSTIDDAYNTRPFNFQTNSWYRLVLNAPPNQGVRAAVLDDNGVELTGASFAHGASAFSSGFKIVLSQFGAASGAASTNTSPVDVAVDYAKLTTGQSGEVNQAFYGDGVATRMIVPRCPELNVGQGRGFSIEGWINPANVLIPAPLVQWYAPAPPTNQTPLGVQFWLALSNVPGALGAVLWDTNSLPHGITTLTNALTNGGWQHVALTYSTNTATAVLYTNGQQAAAVQFPTNFVPRTYSDLYFGFDPTIGQTPINYPNFSSVAGLSMVDFAAQSGNVLRLTPAHDSRDGLAFVRTKQACARGFQTTFQFRMSNLGSINGAESGGDGIAFVVQNVVSNSVVPYANDPNGVVSPQNFVSVWFNTGYNWPGCYDYTRCDMSDNCVGVVTNDLYAAQTDLNPIGLNLRDGAVHTVQITFDGTVMNVWMDNVKVLANVAVPPLKAATDNNGNAWVGFGSFCGWSYANQDILSWTFGGPTPGTCYAGGLDEFSLYQRALTPCEVNAIYNAGSRGKYGTNVLVCPVATEGTLLTGNGNQTYVFTNGVTWTNNGPQWETNTISFLTSTNPTA